MEEPFNKAEKFLKTLGHEVVNPLRNGLKASAPWIERICKDIELLHECDAIYMLKNWKESTGASIEYDFAVRTGKTVFFASTLEKRQGVVLRVEEAIHEIVGLKLRQYAQKSRKYELFIARLLFSHYCKELGVSTTDIAKVLNRAYNSVIYFIDKYHDEVKYHRPFRKLAEQVGAILKIEQKQTEDEEPKV